MDIGGGGVLGVMVVKLVVSSLLLLVLVFVLLSLSVALGVAFVLLGRAAVAVIVNAIIGFKNYINIG